MKPHQIYRLPLLLALLCLSQLAQAQEPSILAQIQACRATSSLLVLRGEGFPEKHLHRLERDLSALADSLRSPSLLGDSALQQHYQHLTELLRMGRDFGPDEENLPWSYPKDLNRALNTFLARAEALSQKKDGDRLALQLEYLAVQYLSRAYIGDYEIPRELSQSYLGQDESSLTPAIQLGFSRHSSGLPALQAKQMMDRWRYLKPVLDDLNSQAASSRTRSGRPFVPMIVDRQTRLLSEALLLPGDS